MNTEGGLFRSVAWPHCHFGVRSTKNGRILQLAKIPAFTEFDQSLPLIELMSGASVLFVGKVSAAASGMEASLYGQQSPSTQETIDLMIASNSKEDFERHRTSLNKNGMKPPI